MKTFCTKYQLSQMSRKETTKKRKETLSLVQMSNFFFHRRLPAPTNQEPKHLISLRSLVQMSQKETTKKRKEPTKNTCDRQTDGQINEVRADQ